jgi:hypothetical protein
MQRDHWGVMGASALEELEYGALRVLKFYQTKTVTAIDVPILLSTTEYSPTPPYFVQNCFLPAIKTLLTGQPTGSKFPLTII